MAACDSKKLLKRVLVASWWVVIILFGILLCRIIGAKMRGQVPSVFGYSVVNIVSGSMEDEIPQNSYILIKKVNPSKIKKDDIICFYSTDPSIYGIPNTHRVVEEPIISDTGIEFVTKGDANPANDKVNAQGDRLVGVYVKRLDYLTSFSEFLSEKTMVFVILSLQFCIIAFVAYGIIKSKTGKEKSSENEGDKAPETNSGD